MKQSSVVVETTPSTAAAEMMWIYGGTGHDKLFGDGGVDKLFSADTLVATRKCEHPGTAGIPVDIGVGGYAPTLRYLKIK